MKTVLGLALGVLFLSPLAADAQAYGCNGGFFFPCSPESGMREQLVVYAWGPGTTAQSPFNNYNSYQPYYQQYQPAYFQPSYNYYQPYSYPQYSYSQPSFGYGPQPMGTQDLWGNNLCDWGGGYRGYACGGNHPAQWILDPYTGQYY